MAYENLSNQEIIEQVRRIKDMSLSKEEIEKRIRDNLGYSGDLLTLMIKTRMGEKAMVILKDSIGKETLTVFR